MANAYPIRPESETVSKPNPENSPGGNSEKKIQQVTKGKVTTRKQSLAKKAAAAFIAEDVENVKEYIIFDVVIPKIKDTFLDALSMLLRGSTYTGRRDYVSANNRVNYSSYSYRSGSERGDRGNSPRRRDTRQLDDIIFETRVDCEEVIAVLEDTIQAYGKVSVADVYDACGITGEYTDNKWGWFRGAEFYPRRVTDGYTIDFPKITMLS